MDKYEYLTGEDLGLKPSTVEQAKFEYSPLGKIFNKGLKEEDKKEGLLKRLKNIETNQKSNNNDKSESSTPLSSVRSKSSTKTLSSDDDDDDKAMAPFVYSKDNTNELFNLYPDIFDLDLK